MLQKLSRVSIADNSGMLFGRIMHLYRGGLRKRSSVGFGVLVVATEIYVRRRKKKARRRWNQRSIWYGTKKWGLIVRTRGINKHEDGSGVYFLGNSVAIMRKEHRFRARRVYGAIDRAIQRSGALYRFSITY